MIIRYGPEIFYLQRYGGISKYIIRLCEELLNHGNDCKIIAPLYTASGISKNLILGLNLPFFRGSHRLYGEISKQLSNLILSKSRIDIYHQSYYSDLRPHNVNTKNILTVHDMAHELIPNYFRKNDNTSLLKYNAIKNSDKIICISNSTRDNLLNYYPELDESKVSVVHLGFDSSGLNLDTNYFNKSNYILYVGNRAGYKNFTSFISSIGSNAKLKNKIKVVLFGGGKLNNSEHELIKKLGFKDGIIECIHGNHLKLQNLYKNALCFVYPSIHEGFGIPLLESMSEGCPVICSDISVFREVAGDAAMFCSPFSIESISNAIEILISNSDIRCTLINNGFHNLKKFGWNKCAGDTLNVYKSALYD